MEEENGATKKPQAPAGRQRSAAFLRMMQNMKGAIQQGSPAVPTPPVGVSSTVGSGNAPASGVASVTTTRGCVPGAEASGAPAEQKRKRPAFVQSSQAAICRIHNREPVFSQPLQELAAKFSRLRSPNRDVPAPAAEPMQVDADGEHSGLVPSPSFASRALNFDRASASESNAPPAVNAITTITVDRSTKDAALSVPILPAPGQNTETALVPFAPFISTFPSGILQKKCSAPSSFSKERLGICGTQGGPAPQATYSIITRWRRANRSCAWESRVARAEIAHLRSARTQSGTFEPKPKPGWRG